MVTSKEPISSEEYYDSGDDLVTTSGSEEEGEDDYDSNAEEEVGDDDDEIYYDSEDDDDDDGFEDQGSSSSEDDEIEEKKSVGSDNDDDGDRDGVVGEYDLGTRSWGAGLGKRDKMGIEKARALYMHTDDISSDEEDEEGANNRIGKVPLHWYDDEDHIGYTVHGKKVIKGTSEAGDLIDRALKTEDELKKGKFTITDALNGKEVALTPRQIELIRRVQAGSYAHPEFDGNAEYVDYFSGVDPEQSGLKDNICPPKARFQPSKWDQLQIRRLLWKLNNGRITIDHLTGKIHEKEKQGKDGKPFLLWKDDDEDELATRRGPPHIPAPKLSPPQHAESYNPPEEYLPTTEDLKNWEDLDVEDRPHGLMVPKKFDCLRHVGAYEHSIREQFQRCLDLYLCPRVLKRRLNIDPESLVPSLPKPSDLRPFPTTLALEYVTPYDGNQAPPKIMAISVSPDGQFLVSGGSDGFVRMFEVHTTRLLQSWDVSSLVLQQTNADSDDAILPVLALEWNPTPSHHCVVAAVGTCAVIISTGTASYTSATTTSALLDKATYSKNPELALNPNVTKAITWIPLHASSSKKVSLTPALVPNPSKFPAGPVCILKTNSSVTRVTFHKKGDYFLTVSPKAEKGTSLLIHQLSKISTQQPFTRKKDIVNAIFHPKKPFLFVAYERYVKIFHLVKQTMMKKLLSNCRSISSMSVHPSGDHILLSSLDRKVVYFDLDLSSTPYKTLKYHTRAVRQAQYSTRFPLLASCSDDTSIHIFHNMVYEDYMRNPLIVPVKIIKGYHAETKDGYGILSICWHGKLPWIFSGGADGKIFCYQDI